MCVISLSTYNSGLQDICFYYPCKNSQWQVTFIRHSWVNCLPLYRTTCRAPPLAHLSLSGLAVVSCCGKVIIDEIFIYVSNFGLVYLYLYFTLIYSVQVMPCIVSAPSKTVSPSIINTVYVTMSLTECWWDWHANYLTHPLAVPVHNTNTPPYRRQIFTNECYLSHFAHLTLIRTHNSHL